MSISINIPDELYSYELANRATHTCCLVSEGLCALVLPGPRNTRNVHAKRIPKHDGL